MAKKKTRVLTVCLANAARSPTAEWLLVRNYNVKSCGVSKVACKPCEKADIKWADKIVVMEPYQEDNLRRRFPKETRNKIVMLDVPEIGKYRCMPSLITEIQDTLKFNGFKPRKTPNLAQAQEECAHWTWRRQEEKEKSKSCWFLGDFKEPEFEGHWAPKKEEKEEPWWGSYVEDMGDINVEAEGKAERATRQLTLIDELEKFNKGMKRLFGR